MALACPKCGKTLTNRRRPKCGHCGSPLGDSIRIPADKRELLRQSRADEEKQHKEFMERNAPGIDPHISGLPDAFY